MTEEKGAPTADHFKFAYQVNLYVTEYIKLADAKVAGLITLTGAAFSLFIGPLKPVFADLTANPAQTASIVLGTGMLVGLVGTFFSALSALGPRTPRSATSLTSFPDIAQMNADDYVKQVLGKTRRVLPSNILSITTPFRGLPVQSMLGWAVQSGAAISGAPAS